MCPDVGSYLKRLRLKSNLTLKSVSHKTKIRESILEKIEAGVAIDKAELIQKSYINSFAKVVGADIEKISLILQSKSRQKVKIQKTTQKRPHLNFVAASFVMLFIVSLVWFLKDNQIETKETAFHTLESKFYQKERQVQFPSNIESLLNSPNPSFDNNNKIP